MRSGRGISLIEILVVMLSLTIVGSMAFQLLWENNSTVARHLSLSSKSSRLRLLQKNLDQDLSSLYPSPLAAGVRVAESSDESAAGELLSAFILDSDAQQNLSVYELSYVLEEYPEGSGQQTVVRALDPDLEPGRSEETRLQPIFSLGVDEQMEWAVVNTEWRGSTSPARLQFTLHSGQSKHFPTRREILVHGVQQP